MPYSKKWYKSKTVIINALVIAGASIQVLQDWLVAGDFSSVGMTVLATGLINLALRFMTSEAIR